MVYQNPSAAKTDFSSSVFENPPRVNASNIYYVPEKHFSMSRSPATSLQSNFESPLKLKVAAFSDVKTRPLKLSELSAFPEFSFNISEHL